MSAHILLSTTNTFVDQRVLLCQAPCLLCRSALYFVYDRDLLCLSAGVCLSISASCCVCQRIFLPIRVSLFVDRRVLFVHQRVFGCKSACRRLPIRALLWVQPLVSVSLSADLSCRSAFLFCKNGRTKRSPRGPAGRSSVERGRAALKLAAIPRHTASHTA